MTAALLIAGMLALPSTTAWAAAGSSPPPSPVVIQTVPAVAGYPMTLDGQTVTSNPQGLAQFATTNHTNVQNRLKFGNAVVTIGGRQVKVSGAKLYYRAQTVMQLALNLTYRVSFSFADRTGKALDAPQVTGLKIKSSTGTILTVPAHGSSWLLGAGAAILLHNLQVTEVMWTVQDVQYAGSNVVNASQQQFFPHRTGDVPIKLLFYSAKVHARDAFFGFPVGSAITLTYPNDTTKKVGLDHHGNALLPSLPRGVYKMVVDGPGPAIIRPLSVSRDQSVDLKVYTWLDIGAAVALVLAFTVGLVAVGSLWRRRKVRREHSGAAPAARLAEPAAQGRRHR